MAQADIAIIGIACRFPGEAKNPTALANMLMQGRDARSKVPDSRFNVDAYHHPFQKRKGNMVFDSGYFLQDDVSKWDAPFFSLSATEAQAVDPQQRLLLEVTYESLENAGISLDALAGTETACFVGGVTMDYKGVITRDIIDTPQNLRGPSLTVETACSSALTALHLACETIRSDNNASRCAIVGGANLILEPDDGCDYSTLGFLSPEGRCFSFDSRANGFARGEGVSALVLKHVDDAVRDGDPIRAVIRATGINSDGRTAGIVLPSSEAQRRLIQSTYLQAGLSPSQTQYIEMHGTGTKAGDPAEMAAVIAALASTPRPSPLYCGSVKTQVGHLEVAAGFPAILKCVLAMERAVIPPTLNLETLNPALGLDAVAGTVVLPTELLPWPDQGDTRRCSVNSFGFGGTNVHVVLDHGPGYLRSRAVSEAAPPPDTAPPRSAPYVFVLSAPEQDVVARQRKTHDDWLSTAEEPGLLPRLAHTLCSRRSVFQWRHAVVARSVDALRTAWTDESLQPSRVEPAARVGLLFTGQGAQWVGMGRELMAFDPFACSVRRSAEVLAGLGCEWDAETELTAWDADESRFNGVEMAQPLCTVLQIALVDLLRHWGVKPIAVTGHSSGEMAAAYAAGLLDRGNCLTVALHRGAVCRLAQEKRPGGGMLAVGLSAENVRPYLDGLSLACINGLKSVTIAGEKKRLLRLQETLKQRGIFSRLLRVDNAFHSPDMATVRDEYLQQMKSIKPEPTSEISMHSTVYGRRVDAPELTAEYWAENLTSTVDLVAGLDDMLSNANVDFIVEVGPHGALAGPVKQLLSARGMDKVVYLSLLSRGEDAAMTAMSAATTLWCKGVPVKLDRLNDLPHDSPAVLVNLPAYSWNHTNSYWHESRLSKNRRFPLYARHDLLGSRLESFNPLQPTWTNRLSVSELPWLRDHVVQGNTIFPAAAIMCTAIEALRQLEHESETLDSVSDFELKDVAIMQPLIVPDDERGVETQLHFQRRRNGVGALEGPWLEAQRWEKEGDIESGRERREEASRYRRQLEEKKAACKEELSSDDHYEFCERVGISFGTCFQGVKTIHHASPTTVFQIDMPNSRDSMPRRHESSYVIHPVTLDSLLQTHLAAAQAEKLPPRPWVPVTVSSLVLSTAVAREAGDSLYGFCETVLEGQDRIKGWLIAGDGVEPAVVIDGLECRGLDVDESSSEDPFASDLYASIVWKPDLDLLQGSDLQRAISGSEKEDMTQFCADAHDIINDMCRLALQRLEPLTCEPPAHLVQYLSWIRTRCETNEPHPPLPITEPQSGEDSFWGIARLRTFVEKYPIDGNLLCHVFSSLDSLFKKQTTPIASLMTSPFFTRFYREAYGVESLTRHIRTWFGLRTHKLPRLRVLEVGAGTAATTVSVLRELGADFKNWTFTDISAGWFERAREVLDEWPQVEYKVLDIEVDPVTQGFEPESYDVVLASNVLHATKDIRETLRHCSSLLKPGGSLVLGEFTNPQDLGAFIFGILPGWWAAEDGRRGGPLLLRHQWDEALKDAGFSGCDAAVTDGHGDDAHRLSTIVSTKLERESQEEILGTKDVVVVVPEKCPEATRKLADDISLYFNHAAVQDISSISKDIQGKTIISLLEYETHFLHDMTESDFNQVKTLLIRSAELLWITRSDRSDEPGHPNTRIISGLLRVVKMEDATRRLYELHLCRDLEADDGLADLIVHRLRTIWLRRGDDRPDEMETAERNGLLCIPRYVSDRAMNRSLARASGRDLSPQLDTLVQAGRPLRLAIGQAGALEQLHFVDDPFCEPLADQEVELNVSACGLNFRDVLIAMGEIQRPVLGHEAVGIVRRVGAGVTDFSPEDRVLCMAAGVMKTTVRLHQSCIFHAPKSLSDDEAASVPVVYATAYQVLVEVARIQKGESVLVHSAAGGVGQALIQLCKLYDAEIFCTVSNEAKKQAVAALGVRPDHVFNSRDLSFEKGIKRVTQNRGVDIVVNSLTGEALQRSWMCLAPHGRFVEVGIRDIMNNNRLEMRPFLNNATFSAVNLETMIGTSRGRKVMNEVIRLFDQGAIKPVQPLLARDFSHVETAFREMQRGKHIGKLVLRFTASSQAPVKPSSFHHWSLKADATYLLVGGFGGLGRAQAVFMAEHGARHLVFVSRSGSEKAEARESVAKLEAVGVRIKSYACDVADREQLKSVLEDVSRTMPLIRGVVQGAMVLRETVFHKMDYRQWTVATRPKIHGKYPAISLPDSL
ncbi:hypothetical protein CDD80_5085 [Ophiocordyceps camponoti-rufipedis]|uniref:Carrier domain-containing protein n=1 Tax=Ophiocordyceps camponoti-rufipedis TaxID=2004952 RepID=A0A2C5ZHW5_9HYPO|nr:hypothetical protein CDD80_5085 [Ophiocordyceps camponoti-rufipedis]